MNDSPNIIRHSRPRAEADWECPRKLYYLREFDGIGLNPDIESLEMFRGTTLHDAYAAIAYMHQAKPGDVDIDLLATTAQKQMYDNLLKNGEGTDEEIENFASEQACLVEGLIRGYFKHVWPIFLRETPKILWVEKDMIFHHDKDGKANPTGRFEFHVRPDLVMASDDESLRVYREHKSTSNKKEKWINSWDKSIQAHATLKAIEQTMGLDLTGIVIQGHYCGYESYGKLSTPIAYAYHRYGNPPFTKTETKYEWSAGFKRYPVWHLEGGVKKWIADMPEEVLMEQFPCTPLIFPDEDLITRFFKQRASRELKVKDASKLLTLDFPPNTGDSGVEAKRQDILDETFPQHFNKCKPAWGFECAFQQLCHGGCNDPLKAGFTYREKRY